MKDNNESKWTEPTNLDEFLSDMEEELKIMTASPFVYPELYRE